MKSAEIRETFLKFFEGKAHQRVKSSSLIPAEDPTILFTNAGMNQFKDNFLGLHDAGYKRATTCQKCVRAGGKHNDLENVGFTARHHTFFEMLGNFSFGDYFKKDAIAFAWELITEHYKIPKDRLRVTVFEKDDEAFELWKAIGVKPEWIGRLGEADNFWAMGDTGPCGPCTEIYYDWGEEFDPRPESAPGLDDGKRFLEIWNLVFMQFNRTIDGKLTPLPKPSVDTGAGLERISAVLQGKFNNYDTDVFVPIIEQIGKTTGFKYGAAQDTDIAMRVISDHMRAGTFLISDGVLPSNEGRGYVLRRILRRAMRYGKKLGQEAPFLFKIVGSVVEQMKGAYPELKANQKLVEDVLREEEQRFHETLHRGMGVLEDAMSKVKSANGKTLPGDVSFKLYDTFGFPLDLVQVIAREHGLVVDEKGFEALMEKQRTSSTFGGGGNAQLQENISTALTPKKIETKFLGYDDNLKADQKKIAAILNDLGQEVQELGASKKGYLVFGETPFYAESGGQAGDKGAIRSSEAAAVVEGTTKFGKAFLHHVTVERGTLKAGMPCDLSVDKETRKQTRINHTATHMLHAALREVLGDRVKQAGSLVDSNRLRFDFTFPRGLTPEELKTVEESVNSEIFEDREVKVEEMAFDKAIASGALAFFDEKYGDRVRVVRIGGEKPYSVELCGGTHLNGHLSDLGTFKILSESSVASGVRRIEAVAGKGAIVLLRARYEALQNLATHFQVKGDGVVAKVLEFDKQRRQLEKEIQDLKLKVAQGGSGGGGGGGQLHDKARDIGGTKLVTETVTGVDPKILRTLVDQVRDKLKEKTVVVLATEKEGRVSLCVGLTKDLVGKFDASTLAKAAAAELGGTGGGKPDFAQAGGANVAAIPQAFSKLETLIKG